MDNPTTGMPAADATRQSLPKSESYLAPLVFSSKENHTHTAIVLHGRGSTAEKFAAPLLDHATSSNEAGASHASDTSFQARFPHTKFVFPTASRRRAVVYNRSFTHQWFDMWPLDAYKPEHKQDVQLKGLRESVCYVHQLLRGAVEEVGAQSVMLMGLSQGCAIGLLALMLWPGEPLGGFVGMCGWLPLRKSMLQVLTEDEEVDGSTVVFEREEGVDVQGEDKGKLEEVVDWLREELEISLDDSEGNVQTEAMKTPIFLAHGTEDEKVPCGLGRLAAQFLESLGVQATWREYEGLGHWYSTDMLGDVVAFLDGFEG